MDGWVDGWMDGMIASLRPFKVADSNFFSENSVLENFFILKQCIIQLHYFRKK